MTYRCAFQVVEASDHCCRHFGYVRPSAYMPHLSLLYADITDEEKKRVEERAYALDETISNLDFPIARLALYKSDTQDKSLKSWAKVDEFDLHQIS
ncbi:unnamed protein product [Cuscuta campestris]|uniref:Cyclic phosphodiesterase-like protein n=1 Tax=Cuscuta campestris TaxID=132261 RepID=A0A484K9G8_9ASTE|nr:unnamed protein product [Cuscuta campestris]